jgi:hypothetical protein
MEYTKIFNGKTDEVKKNIIYAFGVDANNKNAMLYKE